MSDPTGTTPYRVLARKYRPSTFAELIGQDAMVRTLRNAFASGRLAHAFILTGVRGVGKTTTARIIARALNCIGPDGKSGPTIEPCGVCPHCIAIADDRHVDVLEMDAASRTGVDDVRELIEGVAYRPVMGRYKVYIVDEVHMLSKPAFNALLKTLEEPPEHVKFVFATTEIRRIPITVLSRCQRFDLRRVPPELLATHLAAVAGREGAALDDGALRLLVRAADGSVRDALSLLDQAIAHGGGRVDGAASVSEDEMRAMLGLADGGQVLELFETVMRGDAADALARIAALYNAGADPMVVIQDLLELTHWLTRIKLAPEADARDVVTDSERARAAALARRLAMPVLARAWQMLLKGVAEVRTAPSAIQAAEMLIVRLCYVADLPTPAELARGGMPASETRAPTRVSESAPSRVSESAPARGEGASALLRAVDPAPDAGPVAAAAPPAPANFRDAVALFARHREAILHAHLVSDVHLVRFEPGRIEFRPGPNAPANLPNRISDCLGRWTARAWLVVSLPAGDGAPSLHEQDEAAEAQRRNAALSHPLVQAALAAFPGATVEAVRPRARAAGEAAAEADETDVAPADDDHNDGDDAP